MGEQIHVRWHQTTEGLVKKANTVPAPGSQAELIAKQADGHAELVMKHKGNKRVLCKIPNGEILMKIAETGEDYLVRWHQTHEGLVKKTNIVPAEASTVEVVPTSYVLSPDPEPQASVPDADEMVAITAAEIKDARKVADDVARKAAEQQMEAFIPGTRADIKLLKPQSQWTGRLWNTVWWLIWLYRQERSTIDFGPALREFQVRLIGPYGTFFHMLEKHRAVMLIGAGDGFPSMSGMLRKCLMDNSGKTDADKKLVCFIWTVPKMEQLALCFPVLLQDLAKYVQRNKSAGGISDLKKWLTIKIFISDQDFKVDDAQLAINPEPSTSPRPDDYDDALAEVQQWLLHKDTTRAGYDSDGTYIAYGSLGTCFRPIIRNSLFMKKVLEDPKNTLGILYCGPQHLYNWLRSDVANTLFPIEVEFERECA